MRLGFVGAGNMGGAIIRGCAAAGIDAEIAVFDKDAGKLAALAGERGVAAAGSLAELTAASDILILAVKPGNFEDLLTELAGLLRPDQTVVSIAAGISIAYIERFLGSARKIVRVMPNTPAMVGEGMTAASRNARVGDGEFERVMGLFRAVGRAEETGEGLMDVVTGLSGGGPAYVYLFIDALAKGAARNGMEEDEARIFAAQSVLGAAKMTLETGIDPLTLCQNVCSPGGTTIEAVECLRRGGFETLVAAGLQAAVDKSKKLTK